jgi:hypothetical protein
MRKPPRILAAVLLGIIAHHTVVAIFLCEGSVHLERKPLTGKVRALAESGAQQYHVKLDPIQLTSFDCAELSAWFFCPQQSNGDAVILLHGHGARLQGNRSYGSLQQEEMNLTLACHLSGSVST